MAHKQVSTISAKQTTGAKSLITVLSNVIYCVLRPITALQQFMVKSSENSIEAQPYNLIHNHPIFENILNDLFTSFKRNKAQSIGSTLLTNVAKKHCEVCMYVSFKVQKI